MLHSKSTKLNILFLAMLFCHIVLPLFIGGLFKGANMYTMLVVSQLLMQGPVIIYLIVTKTNPFKLIPFKFFNPLAILTLVLMTYSLLPLVALVNMISMLFVENALTDVTVEITANSFWLNLLFIAVMPAVSEEFAFRGVFFHSLKDKGIVFAAVISALLFGLMHLNFNQLSYTFVIGIAMAFAVYATGSIFGGMIVHFILNSNSVIMMALLNHILAESGMDINSIMSEAVTQTQTTSSGDMVLSIVLIAIVAAIMLVPALGLYMSTAVICKREFVLKEIKDDFKNLFKKRQTGEERRIVDIVFILCLVFAFGYMIYSLI
ncbi:MAG: CPBP family intramembrane metalloprotease [Lachnospiraceae bacterium]|nr:CPBP family intramembrane metalloprotease [Lachnospiraceae bacterium]